MNFEIIMQKLIQIGVLLSSGVLYVLNQFDVEIIGKAFDQMFSLGLLCVLAYLLYKEWKASQEYNEERDKRLEKLVENNTEALNNFSKEFKAVHDRIDHNRDLIFSHKKQQSNGDEKKIK
jgi:hypothetical protein